MERTCTYLRSPLSLWECCGSLTAKEVTDLLPRSSSVVSVTHRRLWLVVEEDRMHGLVEVPSGSGWLKRRWRSGESVTSRLWPYAVVVQECGGKGGELARRVARGGKEGKRQLSPGDELESIGEGRPG